MWKTEECSMNQLLLDPISRLIWGSGANIHKPMLFRQFVKQNVDIDLYNILTCFFINYLKVRKPLWIKMCVVYFVVVVSRKVLGL